MAKLQENRPHLSDSEYLEQLQSLPQDLMNLGELWLGQEDQVFQPQRFTP